MEKMRKLRENMYKKSQFEKEKLNNQFAQTQLKSNLNIKKLAENYNVGNIKKKKIYFLFFIFQKFKLENEIFLFVDLFFIIKKKKIIIKSVYTTNTKNKK